SADLGFEKTETVVTDALGQWTGVKCADFEFAYLGTTDLGVVEDRVNVLAWEDEQWDYDPAIAGMTIHRFDTSSGTPTVVEADILFNGFSWLWKKNSGDVYASPPKLNGPAVVTHELGHVTGMDHDYEQVTTTMFYAYFGGDWQGTLAGDDRRGLCENYPNGQDECQVDSECEGIDDSQRFCTKIDGINVCEEVRDEVGEFCSRTEINCAEYCVFTGAMLKQGYCSIHCMTDDDCPKRYVCGDVNLVIPLIDTGTKLCVPSGEDTGDIIHFDEPISEEEPDPAGCGCSSSQTPGIGWWLLLGLTGWCIRRGKANTASLHC
ncbi:MAG: matrixin family metalloprotease, partial [Proteobacteria bacterium]|nr:matrixin family metalloprotease [Pseudomonadota bacterium]